MNNGFKVMDSDIHVSEPPDLWIDYIDPAFRDVAPRKMSMNGRSETWHCLGKPLPAFIDRPERQRGLDIRNEIARQKAESEGIYQPDKHESGSPGVQEEEGSRPEHMLEAVKVEGLDAAVCFRTMAAHVIGIDDMDPNIAAAICRAFNRWLRDYCDADPSVLKLGALVPMHDVNLAVREAEFAVNELGAVTLVLPSNPVRQRPWYDPYYEPFWAAAQSLGVPVSFHGIQMAYQDHLARRYMDNHALGHSVAHPVEMMCTLGAMLTGGVLERLPDLKAAFLEGHSSWVPWWLYCLDEHEEMMGDKDRFGLTRAPSEYFLERCFVSVDPDEALVKYTIQAIGSRNLVISTDWPHNDSAYPHAIETFLSLDGVPESSQREILWDNCARLYNIP